MTNEQRKQRIENILKVVGLGIVGFIVSPVIFATIQGLIGLIIAAAVGLFAVNVAIPWYSMKIANWRIKAIKAEAAKNPVETLQNQYMQQESKLEQFAKQIGQFVAAIENFSDKLKMFEKQFPDEAPKFREQLTKMKQLLKKRQESFARARQELKAFDMEITKVDAIWKMAQEAIGLNQAAGMTDGDFMEKISRETAIDSVTTSLNTAIADLEVDLMENTELPQLANTPAGVTPLLAKEPIGINN